MPLAHAVVCFVSLIDVRVSTHHKSCFNYVFTCCTILCMLQISYICRDQIEQRRRRDDKMGKNHSKIMRK